MKTMIHNWNEKMVKWFLLCYLFTFLPLSAQVGTWRTYMSYYEPQQIVKAQNTLFVRASNDLYQYNLNDHSITTYDKTNALSDNNIRLIGWNNDAKRLLIVYENSNIDIMDVNGQVNNVSALYNKSMTQSKGVNGILMNSIYAYLGTDFGVMKVNMQRYEVSETYMLNTNIKDMAISNGKIYARNLAGYVFSAALTDNLLNAKVWSVDYTADDALFSQDLSAWNEYLSLVNTLKPGGPKYNNFGFMLFDNQRLYSCGGGFGTGYQLNRPGCVQILNDEWTFLEDGVKETTEVDFLDLTALSIDPLNNNRIIASGRTGVYEFTDNVLTNYWNYHNSPLKKAQSVTTESKKYTLVMTNTFDKNGNFWCYNSQSATTSLACLTKDGQWETYDIEGFTGLNMVMDAMCDSKGNLWFVDNHWNTSSLYCFDPLKKELIYSLKSLTNQDGTTYENFTPNTVREDLNGNYWMGTTVGLFMIDDLSNDYVTQVKVPRNDGTNYADYLMANININNIVIDGGNRKWIGTQGNGVYLISADNMTQLEHFTTDNSPLLSNNIESLAINQQTGELFIGTDQGLCSYMSDGTTASIDMVENDVYAYPNPVQPGYDGLITIVGLSLNADVKILSVSGQLVAQGRSNGGSFTWDGKDVHGKRVASGIYMVAAATSDGKKGTVCKIAIIN